jgi:secretion/DNA translocation related TadE-like protein
MRRLSLAPGERGSMTVVAVGFIGVLLVLLLGGLALVSAVRASHHSRSAADLAALAAAGSVRRGESAASGCRQATAVASANRAQLRSCTAGTDRSVTVVVAVQAEIRFPGLATTEAVARARAGPRP